MILHSLSRQKDDLFLSSPSTPLPPQISCPPYSVHAMVSLVRLLQLPLGTLKSFVQLMHMHLVSSLLSTAHTCHPLTPHALTPSQYPPPGIRWGLKVCITVPGGFDLLDMAPMFTPGAIGVIYKGKLLIFVSLGRQCTHRSRSPSPSPSPLLSDQDDCPDLRSHGAGRACVARPKDQWRLCHPLPKPVLPTVPPAN